MYFTSRILTLVVALAAHTAHASPLKRIYDQSQSGDLNILAELDKIVILIIPSKSVNIVDMDAMKGQSHPHTANESYDDLLSLLGKQRENTKSKTAEIPVLKEKVKNNLDEIAKPSYLDGISYYEPSSQKLSQDLANVISASKMLENKQKTDDGALENRQNDQQELSKMEENFARADKNKVGEPEKVVPLKSDYKQPGKNGGGKSEHDISKMNDIPQPTDDTTKKNEPKKDHSSAKNIESGKKELEKSNIKIKDIIKSIEQVMDKTEKARDHIPQSKIKEQESNREEMRKDVEKETSERFKDIAENPKEIREKSDEKVENPKEIIEKPKETEEQMSKREKPVESNSVINKENALPTTPAGKTDSEDLKHYSSSDVQFYKKSSASKPLQEMKNYRLVQSKLNADRNNAAVFHHEDKKEHNIPSTTVKTR